MSGGMDAWDAYRLFCVSAAASVSTAEEGVSLLQNEELCDRLGLVEDCIDSWSALHRNMYHSSVNICVTKQQRLVADEMEERCFIESDAAHLPYTLFAQLLGREAHRLFILREGEARQRVFQGYLESFRSVVFDHYEALRRMQLTWEALDSLAVKACHIGRSGRREGQLARTSAPGYTFKPAPLPASLITAAAMSEGGHAPALWLMRQEAEERRLLDGARWQFMAEATRWMVSL